ncbi:hypothetical protein FB567DRAFT_579425 [Paraphoma chrysanthemicola]|uniref:Uncharacterized protein n=1 Tax=Paraphoma chrysanthemicola TaxID=798071 RepID=A0A8K0R8D5_9PLEO|nr:hypothetical protein FB567DRAFT_579425 [Paraphoma chrysanthemicola]
MQYLPSIEHATFKKQSDSSVLPAILSIGISAERSTAMKEARKHFVGPFATAHDHIELLTVAKYYFVLAGEAKRHGIPDNAFPMTTAFENHLKRLCERLRTEMAQRHYGGRGTNKLQDSSATSSAPTVQSQVDDAGSDKDDGCAISAATSSIQSLSLQEGGGIAPAGAPPKPRKHDETSASAVTRDKMLAQKRDMSENLARYRRQLKRRQKEAEKLAARAEKVEKKIRKRGKEEKMLRNLIAKTKNEKARISTQLA